MITGNERFRMRHHPTTSMLFWTPPRRPRPRRRSSSRGRDRRSLSCQPPRPEEVGTSRVAEGDGRRPLDIGARAPQGHPGRSRTTTFLPARQPPPMHFTPSRQKPLLHKFRDLTVIFDSSDRLAACPSEGRGAQTSPATDVGSPWNSTSLSLPQERARTKSNAWHHAQPQVATLSSAPSRVSVRRHTAPWRNALPPAGPTAPGLRPGTLVSLRIASLSKEISSAAPSFPDQLAQRN